MKDRITIRSMEWLCKVSEDIAQTQFKIQDTLEPLFRKIFVEWYADQQAKRGVIASIFGSNMAPSTAWHDNKMFGGQSGWDLIHTVSNWTDPEYEFADRIIEAGLINGRSGMHSFVRFDKNHIYLPPGVKVNLERAADYEYTVQAAHSYIRGIFTIKGIMQASVRRQSSIHFPSFFGHADRNRVLTGKE